MGSPFLQKAQTNEDGTKVILFFSETLHNDLPSTGQFSVTLDGTETGYSDTKYASISSCVVNGSTVEINLATAINRGSVIKVSYNDPSSGNDTNAIQDANGTDAKSFTNRNVKNIRGFTTYEDTSIKYHGYSNSEIYNHDAIAALKNDGSVVTWGNPDAGGNSSTVSNEISSGVEQIFSSSYAFAALKSDGSVVTWGSTDFGGDSSSVSDALSSGVISISSSNSAYAALKSDGSVVTWGYSSDGGDSNLVSDKINSNVSKIYSTENAFAALKSDGSVVTWGTGSKGGNSSNVSEKLSSGVKEIFSTGYAFAALKNDGSVVTWGEYMDSSYLTSDIASKLTSGVTKIFSDRDSFAALKNDGSVVTWGPGSTSSDISDVLEICSNLYAFAALKNDGSVVTWGTTSYGGDSSSVSSELSSDVIKIFAAEQAFAALKSDGSVVTWGYSDWGGDSYLVSDKINSGVSDIFATRHAFAALKDDGSVITWGHSERGGDSSSVSSELSSGVIHIHSVGSSFAALKQDGSVVTWGDTSVYGAGDSSSVSSELSSGVVGFADPLLNDIYDPIPKILNSSTSAENKTYILNESINIDIKFSEEVYVEGTPSINLETGDQDTAATFLSGSGTDTLTFKYEVQSGDKSTNLDYVSENSLSLNGGSIKDAKGNNSNLALPASGSTNSLSGSSAINVDGVDDGDASFAIKGNVITGETISIEETQADPDGTGSLSYSWKISSDNISWSEVSNNSSYIIDSSFVGKKIKAIISYTDNQGYSESVTTSSADITEKTYSISTTVNSPQEGYTLTTTASTTNVAEGSTLYWSLSGTNISILDFSDGNLTGSGTIGSDGTFSFKHLLASDGITEGYEKIDIKLFTDSSLSNQVGDTKSLFIRDAALEEKVADIVEDINGLKQIVSQLIVGQNYTLSHIKDYDGNLHANASNDNVSSSYKYQGLLDVNLDGTKEAIYTNRESGRWVTASVNSETGQIDYTDYGKNGTTRVVGIYIDPLVESGDVVKNSDHDSQRRFQNDLEIDNLIVKKAGDFDSDNFQEVYWKTNDGTAYLRALMHADGNIQYANYQSQSQMTEYLTANGYESNVSEIIS